MRGDFESAEKKINLFHVNVPFLCPLETSKNLNLSGVFRGYGNGPLAWNGLKTFNIIKHFTSTKKAEK